MKNSLMLGMATVALALLAGCGGSSYSSSSTGKSGVAAATTATAGGGASAYGHATASTTTSATSGAGAITVTSKPAKLGAILAAGPKKLTVYMFEADRGSASACSGACANAWPPVTTTAAASAAGAARTADLGTIARPDGTRQVTYKGHPLYYFVKDKDSGDAYGEGVKAFGAGWYVLAPSGRKIDNS